MNRSDTTGPGRATHDDGLLEPAAAQIEDWMAVYNGLSPRGLLLEVWDRDEFAALIEAECGKVIWFDNRAEVLGITINTQSWHDFGWATLRRVGSTASILLDLRENLAAVGMMPSPPEAA